MIAVENVEIVNMLSERFFSSVLFLLKLYIQKKIYAKQIMLFE